MNRRNALHNLAKLGIATAAGRAFAQPVGATPVVAILGTGTVSPRVARFLDTFLAKMREFGYEDGRNFRFETHTAKGDYARLNELAAALVSRRVDVIIAGETPAGYAAREATKSIPIVLAGAFDAQASGLVTNLARPEANITGLSALSFELFGKRFEILRELIPGLERVAFLASSLRPNRDALSEFERLLATINDAISRGIDDAARRFAISVVHVRASDPASLERTFAELGAARIGALYVQESPALMVHRDLIAELALRHRFPTITGVPVLVDSGGLVSYGVDHFEVYRRVAIYVDKLLRGARPGDLPVEQPTAYTLALNLKTAAALGIRVPPTIRVRATQLIE